MNKVKASLKQKNESAIKIGVLSAAAINYTAIFDPIQSHPDVVITAIAARSKAKAEAQIAKYQLDGVKAYGSYDELLQDGDVDVIYIPVPNGLHTKWALKAMKAGKHVLIEKPISNNAAEAKEIQECSQATNKVALEAYHWRFHPAAHRVKQLIESGKYGLLISTFTKLIVPPGAISADDIRFKYDLGGGSSMDLAYVFSSSLYWASSASEVKNTRFEVIEAKPIINKSDNNIDEGMDTTISINHPDTSRPAVKCTTHARLARPKLFGLIPQYWDLSPGVVLELEKAKIEFTNFVGPWIGHKIIITEKPSGKKTVENCYVDGPEWGTKGQDWWTTYRYQLEAFVERIKKADGGEIAKYEGPWVSLDESVKVMEIVDAVYQKCDMPVRGAAA